MATEVKVKISAEDKTKAALDAAKKRLDSMEGSLNKMGRAATTARGYLNGLAAAASVAVMAGAINEQLKYAGVVEDGAKQTGLSIENFQKFGYAAEQNGSSVEQMTGFVSALNKEMAKARAGDDKSNKKLMDAGIDVRNTKDGTEAFLKMSDAFKAAGNSAGELEKKTAILKNLKTDPSFIQTLDLGSQAMLKLGNEAASLGLIMSDDVVTSLAEFDDKLGTLKKQADVSTAIFAAGMVPALTDVADAFLTAGQGGDVLKTSGEFVGEVIKEAAKIFIGAITAIYLFGKAATSVADGVFTRMVSMGRAIGGVARAFAALVSGQGIAAAMGELTQASKEIAGNELASEARIKARSADSDAAIAKAAGLLDKLNASPTPKADEASKPEGAKPPKIRPLGTQSLNKEGPDKQDAVDKARAALVKAEAEASAKIRTAIEQKVQADLKDMLEDSTISYRDYYAGLAKSQQAAIDIRMEALRTEAAEQQKLIGSSSKEADKLAAQAKLKTITADIKVLEIERGEIAGKAARDQRKDEKELAKSLADVEIQTKTLLDTLTSEDRAKVVAAKFEELLKRAKAEGKGVEEVTNLMRLEAMKADLSAKENDISNATSRLSSQTSSINADPSLSRMEKRQKIADANREAQKSLEDSIPALEQLAAEFPEYTDKVTDAKTALQELKNASDEVARSINEDFQSQLSDAIYGIASGEKSPAQAFKDLFKGVGKSIAKQVSDDIASSFYTFMKSSGFNPGEMISGLLKGSSGGGTGDVLGDFIKGGMKSGSGGASGGFGSAMSSVGDWFKNLFSSGFRDGDYTGSGNPNEVAGVAHKGEFYFSAPAVNTLGVPLLRAMHNRAKQGLKPIAANTGGFSKGDYTGDPSRRGIGGPATVNNWNIKTEDVRGFKEASGRINSRAAQVAQRDRMRNS